MGTKINRITAEETGPALQLKRSLLPINEYATREGLSKNLVEEWGKLGIVQIRKYKGKMYYIGDWHTHPNGSSTPSKTDDINQSAVASDKKANCPENILVIIGGSLNESPEIGVYVYSRRKGRIDLFPIVEA